MAEKQPPYYLAPSDYHRYLADRTTPLLSYTSDDPVAWKQRLRPKLEELLGFAPPRERCALNARSLWKREHALGTIEKVVFTSEIRADVPAYVCLPRNASPPYAFMICLQGHSTGMHNSIAVDRQDETTPINVEGDRDFALGCMARGVAALCIEQRGFGERAETDSQLLGVHNCHSPTMQALMLGRTIMGQRVYDVDRAIDYLRSRGDAKMTHIGVMGNSGGGTTSIYASALLPRVSFSMPSCAFCRFVDSWMSVLHCMCGYVPGILRYAEMADILGLLAPKPVVVVAGKEDPIAPIAGVHRAFADLRRIYEAVGAEERCHLVVGQDGHRFYAAESWPVLLVELDRL